MNRIENYSYEMDEPINELDFKQSQIDISKNTASDNKYENNTPLDLNRELFDTKMYDWFSNIAAVDLISTKNIDVFIADEQWNLNEVKTQEFDKLLKKNFLEIKIFQLAKQVSLSGIAAIWFEPNFIDKDIRFSLNNQINIIKMTILNNEIIEASFLVNLTRGISQANCYALVKATKKEYSAKFYKFDSKWEYEEKDKLFEKEYKNNRIAQKEAKAILDSYGMMSEIIEYLNKEHNFSRVPIFPLYFNENFQPLIRNIEQDMDELYSIAEKCYDEAHFAGTKVIWLNANPVDSQANKVELKKYQKVIASSAGIYAANEFGNDNLKADVDLQTKMPIWINLNDAFKQKINNILKMLGLSSDTDSKGTVQQSIGELIKQNEYSFNNQNYRNLVLQNYLQDLLEAFYLSNFNDNKSIIKVISTQSLGMSEYEKLRYVIDAMNNNIIDQARAISIISGKNYIDSLSILKMQKLQKQNSINEVNNSNLEIKDD